MTCTRHESFEITFDILLYRIGANKLFFSGLEYDMNFPDLGIYGWRILVKHKHD